MMWVPVSDWFRVPGGRARVLRHQPTLEEESRYPPSGGVWRNVIEEIALEPDTAPVEVENPPGRPGSWEETCW